MGRVFLIPPPSNSPTPMGYLIVELISDTIYSHLLGHLENDNTEVRVWEDFPDDFVRG